MQPHHPHQVVVADTPDSFEDARFLLDKMIEVLKGEREIINNLTSNFREEMIRSLLRLRIDTRSHCLVVNAYWYLKHANDVLSQRTGADSEATRSISNILEGFENKFSF